MIHPENVTRTLLSPTIMSKELARLCGLNDSFADWGEIQNGTQIVRLGCGGKKPVRVEFPLSDLLMSLDEFSDKHIAPLVPLFTGK